MPRAGLTNELKSGPSEVSTADLKESMKAGTWGSEQILAGAGTLAPGRGVRAPGVSVSEGGNWVERDNVGVAVAGRGVGIWAVGAEQLASRLNPIRMTESIFVFIIISSFGHYIPLTKEKRRISVMASGVGGLIFDLFYASPKTTTTMC